MLVQPPPPTSPTANHRNAPEEGHQVDHAPAWSDLVLTGHGQPQCHGPPVAQREERGSGARRARGSVTVKYQAPEAPPSPRRGRSLPGTRIQQRSARSPAPHGLVPCPPLGATRGRRSGRGREVVAGTSVLPPVGWRGRREGTRATYVLLGSTIQLPGSAHNRNFVVAYSKATFQLKYKNAIRSCMTLLFSS
jgi:hypothetical protein